MKCIIRRLCARSRRSTGESTLNATHYCPKCMRYFTVDEKIGFKLGVGGATALAAAGLKLPGWAILLAGVGGAIVTHAVDKALKERCPDCEEVLLLLSS